MRTILRAVSVGVRRRQMFLRDVENVLLLNDEGQQFLELLRRQLRLDGPAAAMWLGDGDGAIGADLQGRAFLVLREVRPLKVPGQHNMLRLLRESDLSADGSGLHRLLRVRRNDVREAGQNDESTDGNEAKSTHPMLPNALCELS